MENIYKSIRNGIIALVAATSLYARPCFSEPIRTKGISAKGTLETAVTRDVIRDRLYTDLEAYVGSLKLGYHGLNEINDLESKTYFGRHRLTLGEKSDWQMLVDLKTDCNGLFYKMFGVRNTGLMKKLGGYGKLDLTAGDGKSNVTAFYGKDIGRGWSVELFQDSTFGKRKDYTELQLNKQLSKDKALFCRTEMSNFKNPKYLAGLSFRLGK